MPCQLSDDARRQDSIYDSHGAYHPTVGPAALNGGFSASIWQQTQPKPRAERDGIGDLAIRSVHLLHPHFEPRREFGTAAVSAMELCGAGRCAHPLVEAS